MGRKALGEKALTKAEKQRRYRARLSAEKKKKFTDEDRLRHQLKRADIKSNATNYEEYKEKQRLQKRKQREDKIEEEEEQTAISTSMHAAALSRSLKKLKKNLPRTKTQQRVVAKALFEDTITLTPKKKKLLSNWARVTVNAPQGRPNILNDEKKNLIEQFLCRNDISYTLPGRNNQVYLRKVDGVSQFLPKRYLLWTFQELHNLLKNEENLDDIRLSSLYRYIKTKKQFIQLSKIPEVSCLCPDCENFELLCQGINNCCPDVNLEVKCYDFLNMVACQPITEECCNGSCKKCPELDMENLKDYEAITFTKWFKGNKYYEKSSTTESGENVSNALAEQIMYIRGHYYRKRVQAKEYVRQIENLKEGEVLIHVDYSENYKNKQQNEIKAAYYGQGTFSIYTVVVYTKNVEVRSKSMALVTEENDHSCNVSYALNQYILHSLREEQNITTAIFWSDGCASQFRSQYAFFMLTKFDPDLKVQWHFFEANHGKGAVDGVGGTVKHAVYRHVLSGRVVIKTPQQFAEYADSILEKVSVVYLEQSDLELQHHNECREQAIYIKGTLKVHFVDRVVTPDSILLKFFSTSTSSIPINEVKFNNNIPALPNNIVINANTEYQEGDYCLVQFEGELWPGQITKENSNNTFRIRCYEKAEAPLGSTWRWPKRTDEQEYRMEEVIKKINTPEDVPGTLRNLVVRIPELEHIWG